MKPADLTIGDKCIIGTSTDYTYEIIGLDYGNDPSCRTARETNAITGETRECCLMPRHDLTLIKSTSLPPTNDFELDLDASPIGYHYICRYFSYYRSTEISDWLNEGDSKGYELVSIIPGQGSEQIIYMRKARNA